MASHTVSAALAEADWQLRSQYPDYRRCCSILTTFALRPADAQSLSTADAQLVASLTRRMLFRLTSSDAALRRPADDWQACSLAAGAALSVLRLWLQAHTLRGACDKEVLDIALHCAWQVLESSNGAAKPSGNLAAEAVLLLADTSSVLATKSTIIEHWHKLMQALTQSSVCKAVLSWRQQLSTVVSTLLLRHFEQQQQRSQSTAAIVTTILQMWQHTITDTDNELYCSAFPDLATSFCSITHSPACTASVCEVVLSVCTNYGKVMQQNNTTQATTQAAAIVALSGLLRGIHTVLQQSRTAPLDKTVTDRLIQQQSSAIATLHSASQWCVTNSNVTATVETRQLQCGVGVAVAVAAAALCEMYNAPSIAAAVTAVTAVTQSQIGVFNTALQHVITTEAMCLHDLNGVAIASPIQSLLPMQCDALGKLIYIGAQATRQMCVTAVIDAVQAVVDLNAVAVAAHSTTATTSFSQGDMLAVATSLRRATAGGVLSLIGAVVQAATIANDTIKLSDLVRYVRLSSWCSAVPIDSNAAQAATAIVSLNSMLREQLLTSLAHHVERHGVDGVYAVMQTMPAVENLKSWCSSSSSSSSALQSIYAAQQPAPAGATTSSSSSSGEQQNGDNLAIVAYSSDRVWLYVQLAERWLASTGHVMQQLVCSKLIPLLLFTCFSNTLRPGVLMLTNSSSSGGSVYSRQLSTTATAAHTVLWQLLSYQYLLYDAPVASTTSNTTADTTAAVTLANTELASGHTVRQRLACAYCKLALHTYPVVTDAAVLSSAIGLLIGAMGQSECDQGAAISCLQSVKERVVQLCTSDSQLLDEATRTCLSLLCQALKIAPQRLLPLAFDVVGSAVQEVMQCTKRQQQHSDATTAAASTTATTAGSASNEIAQGVVGRVVFDAIAYDCEPSRRFDVVNWYQKLAVSSRL
jgi:hypothetical protein